MQITNNLMPQSGVMSGMESGVLGGQPETGEFDFFNYLLGLQVNPTADTMSDGAAELMAEVGSKEDKSDPLKMLFAPAQPLFIQDNSQGQMPAEMMQANSNLQMGNRLQEGYVMNEGTQQVQQLADEKRLDIQSLDVDPTIDRPDNVSSAKLESADFEEAEQMATIESFESIEPNSTEMVTNQFGNPEVVVQNQARAARAYTSNQTNEVESNSDIRASSSVSEVRTGSIERADSSARSGVELSQKTSGVSTSGRESHRMKSRSDGQSEAATIPLGMAEIAQSDPNPVEMDGADVPQFEQVATEVEVPELFNRVESMVQRGGGKMTVSLNPPELGQVEIEVSTHGNRVEVSMRPQNEGAKSVLEGQLHELRAAMGSHDLIVSKMEVEAPRETMAHLSNDSFDLTPQQQHQQREFGRFSGQGGQEFQGSNFQETNEHVSARESRFPIASTASLDRPTESRLDMRI